MSTRKVDLGSLWKIPTSRDDQIAGRVIWGDGCRHEKLSNEDQAHLQ